MRLLKRLWKTGGALLARDTAVVTNAIAFNFLLCLFPLLVVAVAAAQRLPAGSADALFTVVRQLIPFEHEALTRSLRGMGKLARGLEALSLLLIVWGSSGIFMPVEMALNRAWGGRPRAFVRSRLLAFVLTMACGALALLSVALTVAARAYRAEWPAVAEYGAWASGLLLTYLLFFLIYSVAADPSPGPRVALHAALWAGTAWEAVKYLFVINLGRANLRLFYGPLAFAVSLVLWAYVSSLVLVFGALMAPADAKRRRRAAA
ncbi:MAG TPA: YihY/virulence factor BrkB family protein [Vicinamibacteria bacterium]|jgi:membrane protein/epoxyqueuosine reductase